jgi:uncharacterized protein
LFEQVGKRGYFIGWSYLIRLYSEKKGVKQNKRKIAKLIELVKRLFDESDAVGQCALRWLYDNGLGISKNEAKAFKLYFLLANQGITCAQHNLG